MIIVCVRTVILYAVVLIAIRIMGKSELSKMSPFQMVIIFMIAELASISIDSTAASLANAVIAIFTLLFLQVLISYISIKNEKFKNFINGKPGIVIDKGELNLKEMSRLRISVNDLAEQLRIAGCPSISDAEYAILEANGSLSVILKAGKAPATPKDLGLVVSQDELSLILLNDGYIYESNMERLGIDLKDLHTLVLAKGIKSLEDVFLAFSDCSGVIHVYGKPGIDDGSEGDPEGCVSSGNRSKKKHVFAREANS